MNSFDSTQYDLDIFCQIKTYHLHLATAGGFIPEQVALNPYHSHFRQIIKNNNNPFLFDYKINPYLEEILTLKSQNQGFSIETFNLEAYLQDFIGYAKRGVFSFDRTYINDSNNGNYHLVAYPIFDEKYIEFIKQFTVGFNFSNIDYNNMNLFVSNIITNRLNRPVRFFI